MKKNSFLSLSFLSLMILSGAAITACDSGSGSSNGSPLGGASSCAVKSTAVQPQGKAEALSRAIDTSQVSHIPPAVRNFADQGKVDEAQAMPVTVALNLNNQADLEQTLADMYQPGNPNFHKFMTPQQLKARYAPTPEQVSRVQAFLQSHGIQSGSISENGLLLHANATAAQLGEAFQTEIHQYKDSQGGSYFSPSVEPVLPAELSIQAVHGLQNVTRWHSYAQQRTGAPKAGALAPTQGATGQGGGFAPADLKTAYQVPTSVNGAGQTLGLMELDGYNTSDITAYEKQYGIPNVPLTNVLIDGSTGSAGGGIGEVTLDIELMMALAPGASSIRVYEGTNSSQGIIDVYSKIQTDNLAKSVSSSWGSSEDTSATSGAQTENTIFELMAAQGQTMFSAGGDSGANDNGSSLSVDDPSGQPYVTGVGGTSLTTSATGAWQSETTWNDSGGAGGGGISAIWPIPSWQAGLATSANLASSTMRNVPDVSFNADPNTGYSIYVSGGWGVWGGTSAAAPLWAAYMALVNQQRGGLGPIGFANPAIYSIGRSGGYGAAFHDISDGSTNGHYPAVTGYDDATGWGSFIGQGLLGDLAGSPSGGC